MSLECISNPEAITSLYDDPSVLNKAMVHALELWPSDPTVKIFIRLESPPVRSPDRWGKPNRTILEMQLLDVSTLHVAGWEPSRQITINIMREQNGTISLITADRSIEIVCGWIVVAKVHPLGGNKKEVQSR